VALTLGVELGPDRPDGSVVVIAVEEGGSVAAAGGRVGDLWLTIDGELAAQVLISWADDMRPRRPDVPISVEIKRNGEHLLIGPSFRDEAVPDTVPAAEPASAPRIYRRPPARPMSGEDAAASLDLEQSILAWMRSAHSPSIADDAADDLPVPAAADAAPPLQPPPRLPIANESSPFGFRRHPPGMPPDDQKFYESSGRTISYSAQDPNYNPSRLPDGPPPASYWDH
jgi:hypothetical protein